MTFFDRSRYAPRPGNLFKDRNREHERTVASVSFILTLGVAIQVFVIPPVVAAILR